MADKVQRYGHDREIHCGFGPRPCGLYVAYPDYVKLKSLHASIIEQGRKVLNATSEIGMSHAEFIEWAMRELEGKDGNR